MPRSTTKNVTVGVFKTRDAAERAIADLKASGYRDDQIGLVAKNAEGKIVDSRDDGDGTAEGAAVGVAVGAAGGAAVGAGIAAGVIPVIGPIIALGTLGTILLNAAGGAAIAGVAGALMGWGLSEEEATYYESEVKAGRYLVTVDSDADGTTDTFRRHGAYNRVGPI